MFRVMECTSLHALAVFPATRLSCTVPSIVLIGPVPATLMRCNTLTTMRLASTISKHDLVSEVYVLDGECSHRAVRGEHTWSNTTVN